MNSCQRACVRRPSDRSQELHANVLTLKEGDKKLRMNQNLTGLLVFFITLFIRLSDGFREEEIGHGVNT